MFKYEVHSVSDTNIVVSPFKEKSSQLVASYSTTVNNSHANNLMVIPFQTLSNAVIISPGDRDLFKEDDMCFTHTDGCSDESDTTIYTTQYTSLHMCSRTELKRHFGDEDDEFLNHILSKYKDSENWRFFVCGLVKGHVKYKPLVYTYDCVNGMMYVPFVHYFEKSPKLVDDSTNEEVVKGDSTNEEVVKDEVLTKEQHLERLCEIDEAYAKARSKDNDYYNKCINDFKESISDWKSHVDSTLCELYKGPIDICSIPICLF